MTGIVIPNYNGISHLKDCLESLRKQDFRDFRTVMVDNGSSDDSVSFTKENYPEVEILRIDVNAGFAPAVNKGIKHLLENKEIKHILLLNNDIECAPGFLGEMIKGFADENTGSVACKMMNFFDRDVIDAAGDFLSERRSPWARGNGEKDEGQYNEPGYVFGACAGAAMYKREVFEKAGYIDEDFISYFEDVDFAFRLQLHGFKCYYVPSAVCYHKRGATTGQWKGYETKMCERNLVALRLKNYPASLYAKNFIFFAAARIKRYLLFFFVSPARAYYAFAGYLSGLMQIPKILAKRSVIQKNISVDKKYIVSLFKDNPVKN
ncbi:MAG: glycosyltransferase family 2 protein [Bacteroidetes bacterium]|nr:glycosyltransferase family 2 protein [Bacteroidota bacterium]